jgi:hypothetical protein
MKYRRMPTVAGIFMLIAAIFNILWLIMAFSQVFDIKQLLRITWVILPLPYIGLAVGFSGNTALSSILASVFVLGILLSIFGGVVALRRKVWGLALTGSVGALICLPLLGIASIILIGMSNHQFKRQEKQR